MGKTTRSSYKKIKKMEKSKVKIKSSKTYLPKGQNVTDTNFKVKKIIIKDQVNRHSEDEILSRKKLTCKELIGRLTHYNSSIKQEALLLLKQLLTEHTEEMLRLNLAPLIESVSKLILDETKDIRKEANKILSLILSQCDVGELSPLFPVMSSYLVCGLTHIDTALREDSLLYLDVLLKWVPQLCASAATHLLPIILDLVSSSTSTSRTLTLNLESKFTSEKWRGNVLARISVLLSILEESQNGTKKQANLSNKNSTTIYKNCLKDCGKVYIPTELSLVNYNFESDRLFSTSTTHQSQSTKNFNLKEFTEVLIPLLFQAFIEMVPVDEANYTEKTNTNISYEVSLVLKHILDILSSLWELLQPAEEEWFKTKFSKAFMNSLIVGRFPYSVIITADMRKRKDKTVHGKDEPFNCQIHNIILIKFILLLTPPTSWSDAITCLKSSFRSSDKLSPTECSLLISCCKIIVRSSSLDTKVFLGKLSKFSRSSNTALSSQAMAAMHAVAIDENLSALHEDINFGSWLEFLPEMLTEHSLSSATLDIISDIARRNFPVFSLALDGRIEYILDKIPELSVQPGALSREEARVRVAQLLYWVKDWDDEMITGLRTAIENNYWGDYVTGHVKDVLNLKVKDLPKLFPQDSNQERAPELIL